MSNLCTRGNNFLLAIVRALGTPLGKARRLTWLCGAIGLCAMLSLPGEITAQSPPSEEGRVERLFPWGSVRMIGGASSSTFRIELSADLSIAESLANSSRGLRVDHEDDPAMKPIFPSHAFYVLVPPKQNVVSHVSNLEARSGASAPIPAIVGFTRRSDTSSIEPVYIDARGLEETTLAPVVAVEAIEWFRGLTLARIRITPFAFQQSEIVHLSSVEFSLQMEGGEGIPLVEISPDDPSFDGVMRHLIVNLGGEHRTSKTPLEWADSTGRWIDYSNQYMRLAIAVDGIYRLTLADLLAKSAPIEGIDPQTFRLFHKGIEIPLFVEGERDGSFSDSDFIEFPAFRNYGSRDYRKIPQTNEEYPSYLDRYTDTSAYWLTWGGKQGLRVETNESSASSTDTLTWYTEVVHIERDNFLQFIGGDIVVHQDPRWLAGDLWGWGWLGANGTFSVDVQANRINRSAPSGKIFARFAGWASQNVTPAHRVRLRLNSSDTLRAIEMRQYDQVLMQADVPSGQWVEGTNTIRVHSLPTQSNVNWILFDWAEAEYPRWLNAESDTLFFGFTHLSSRGVRVVRVTGLSRVDVVIYKCGPTFRRISSYAISGSGPYTVSFADTVAPGDKYMISSTPRLRKPVLHTPRKFPNLRNPIQGADYVLLTHTRFLQSAEAYASFIQSHYKLRTTLINVEDVFAEFGYGYPTPESIREFLKTTTRWQSPMPAFVFIIGDATYDFKYVMSSPNPATRPVNSVPSYGHPVSDSYLAVLDDGSALPQLFVGRIPVSSEVEVLRYLQNHQAYVKARYDDWNKKYIFFAGGDPNVSGQVESFKTANEAIIRSMVEPSPIGGLGTSFYKTKTPQSDYGPYTAQKVGEVISEGAVAINYIGHSGTQTWDNGIGEPSQLQNSRGRFALVSDFGCSTAKFAEPDIKSFGELFTLGQTGSAIAYVGNSALGFTSNALSLPAHFYRQFLSRGTRRIGEIHLQAKLGRLNEAGGPQVLTNRIMMLTNTLIGDPVIELAIPQEANLALDEARIVSIPQNPTEDDEHVKLHIPYMNTGLARPDSFSVSIRQAGAIGVVDTTLKLPLPLFRDTVKVGFAIKGLPGEHQFTVRFNPNRTLKEMYDDDNAANHKLLVASNSFRMVKPHPLFGGSTNEIVVLNPQKLSSGESQRVHIELDTNAAFINPVKLSAPLGNVVTKISNLELSENRLYHWRGGLENSIRPQSIGSFEATASGVFRWNQKDSADWSRNAMIDVQYASGAVRLTERRIDLRVTSSGFVDGGFGAVEFNGINILPNTFGRGHTVALLDSITLSVQQIRVFDTFGVPALSDSLAAFINSLSSGQLVVQLIIDEGANNLSAAARSAIRSLGSALIDSVRYRDSWAIVGKKGAQRGSVLEGWKRTYTGRVIIDTSFVRKNTSGMVLSPVIGPVGSWNNATITAEIPPRASVTTAVLGIRRSGEVDTLFSKSAGNSFDLGSVSASAYPKAQLVAQLQANNEGATPTIREWSVRVTPPAELALNYQSVSLSADRILEGEQILASVSIHNVGYLPANNVRVDLEVVGQKSKKMLDPLIFPIIPTGGSVTATAPISTTGLQGYNTLNIAVDPIEEQNETYRSNNFYSASFLVVGDTTAPSIDVTFDGLRIMDGDYVSAHPEICIMIYDNSPLSITDPKNVLLKLNNRSVALGAHPDSLFEHGTGAEKARVTFRPLLGSGDHLLSIQVRDATGNMSDSTAGKIRFRTERESQLRNVVNIPNPMRQFTNFTFNLVGLEIPEELSVKIYTVAGRLLNEFKIPRSDLRMGFNSFPWDARDREGNSIANGVYFYKLSYQLDGKLIEVVEKLAKVE